MKSHLFTSLFILFTSVKKFICLGLLISIFISGRGQETPHRGKINPDFLNSQLAKDSMCQGIISVSKTIAPPVLPDIKKAKRPKSAMMFPGLPAIFDLRPQGLMSSVKTQTPGGCWGYATLGSLESNWLKQGFGVSDLGEHDLLYCHNFDPSRNTWGNHFISTAYFAYGSGPILQSQDTSSNCISGVPAVSYISDARFPPKNRELIKHLIMENGAVYSMLYYNPAYFVQATNTYCYKGQLIINHAVDLAGWDDTKETAGGIGAWICKNSYGQNWGQNGYFYVSYNDSSILNYNAYWPNRKEVTENSSIYQVDQLGWIEDYGYETDTCDYGLIRFTPTENQQIAELSSYCNTSGGTLKFSVYDDYNSDTKVLSNLLSTSAEVSCEFPGHYFINLETPFNVSKGNDFFIKVKYYTPGYNFPIPVEDTLWWEEGGVLVHNYSNPEIESGRCWISNNGIDGSWEAAGTAENPFDLCIKAFGTKRDTSLFLTVLPEGLFNAASGHLLKARNEYGNQFPGAVADYITVQLANSFQPYSRVFSTSAALDTNGLCQLMIPGNLTGSYYLVVKHRNSLETWSSSRVSFSSPSSLTYDFSSDQAHSFGNNSKLVGNRFVLFSGDVNQDGSIDSADMSPIDNDAMNYISGYTAADINGDGSIDSADMTSIDNNVANYVTLITP